MAGLLLVCVSTKNGNTHTSNKPAIAKLLVPLRQTNTKRPHQSILSYIYEASVFTFNIMVPRKRSNTLRPHCSISIYIRSTCALWGLTCVFIIDTYAYKPSPSQSFWFLIVIQVGPCRRPDNGHYPLSKRVQKPVYTWDIPEITFGNEIGGAPSAFLMDHVSNHFCAKCSFL